MDANSNNQDLQCADLKHILKTKGIPFSNKRKQDLVDLCESADALNLPGIDQNDSEKEASIERRTVRGKTYQHPCYDTGIVWSRNLATIPTIDTFDVTSFLQNYCGWSEERLRRRNSDNGYKLHCSGHIHDVTMAMLGTCKLRKAYHFIVLLTLKYENTSSTHIFINFVVKIDISNI